MTKEKKIILAVVILCTLLLSLYFFFSFSGPKKQPVPVGQNSVPVSAPVNVSSNYYVPTSADKNITIKTTAGDVTTNNIYQNALSQLSAGGVSFKNNNYYYIAYYPQDQGFLIVMQNSDIQTARQMAEDDFLQTLGITKAQACQLRVSLTVPSYIDKAAAGGNYGLSFCPNGKPFPGQ